MPIDKLLDDEGDAHDAKGGVYDDKHSDSDVSSGVADSEDDSSTDDPVALPPAVEDVPVPLPADPFKDMTFFWGFADTQSVNSKQSTETKYTNRNETQNKT